MNSHIPCDLIAYNYFTPKSKFTIYAACTTVHNCAQQLLWVLSYDLGPTSWRKKASTCASIAVPFRERGGGEGVRKEKCRDSWA